MLSVKFYWNLIYINCIVTDPDSLANNNSEDGTLSLTLPQVAELVAMIASLRPSWISPRRGSPILPPGGWGVGQAGTVAGGGHWEDGDEDQSHESWNVWLLFYLKCFDLNVPLLITKKIIQLRQENTKVSYETFENKFVHLSGQCLFVGIALYWSLAFLFALVIKQNTD